MLKRSRVALTLVTSLVLSGAIANAQWRVRIKTLGGTPKSFSAPLNEPDDLRRLIGAHLSDIRTLLRQEGSGWTGRIEDLERAAQFGQVRTVALDTGKRIPWMAMRRHGRPRIYKPRNGMIWDGPNPLQAFSILFESNGRAWTLIAPRACGNLWVSSERLTPSLRKQILDDLDCFHEKQEIQFAPAGSPYNRDGLIMHDNADFGDTAQREGWYWLGVWIRANEIHQPWVDSPPRSLNFDDVERKLEPGQDGIFVRAPGKDPFGRATDGNENHGMTRDQLIPLIAALSVWGKRDALQRLWYALPEDILGKHDFQGHWHDFITGANSYTTDPVNDIRNRNCTSTRVCTLQWDTRSCGHDVDWGLLGKHHFNDPFCEIAKATQNTIYVAQKAACEVVKAAEEAACEVQKGIDVVVATGKKETGLLLFVANDATRPADPLPPSAYNLLVRSGVIPFSIYPVTIVAVSPPGFVLGEANLKGGIDVLRDQGAKNLDYVDQDMNSIVMLWMSRHTIPTPISYLAIKSYRSRAHSYGSYFKRYCEVWGPLMIYPDGKCPIWEPDCCPDKGCLKGKLTARMETGIASGWTPDDSGYGPYGAIRWYNRWATGANPKLATLWEPIVGDLVK